MVRSDGECDYQPLPAHHSERGRINARIVVDRHSNFLLHLGHRTGIVPGRLSVGTSQQQMDKHSSDEGLLTEQNKLANVQFSAIGKGRSCTQLSDYIVSDSS